MTMRDKIDNDYKNALKSKDKNKISTYRLILSGVKDLDINNRSGPNKKETDDEDIKKLLKKMIKQRSESIEIYKKNNRSDLLEIEQGDLDVLSKYLPKQLSEADTKKICEEIIKRHPFPGPGIAIRILGEVNNEKLDCLRDADWIVRDEIKKAGLYNDIWQAFAVLLPVKTVGVMGDKRTYAWPIVLRCVSSEDGMTADWSKIPFQILERIANRIVNEVISVNRVVYDITSKPPGTIEWE